MSEAPEPGKIVTFYSYKGGTGRSMAVANIAWILASCSKRVLVLDWDLEAPGLQRYFRPFLVDKDLISSEGLVDFFTDFILEAITPLGEGEVLSKDWYIEQADILRYVLSLNWKFPKGGLIDFVPAGRQGPDYAARFAAINFQHFYDRLGGGALLEAAKEQMRANYDYILIDSRTGVSDTAGISTIQMPDMLVVCFTFNNQSIEGASAVTRSAFEQHKQSLFRNADDFSVIPVPTRVDQSEQDMLKRRKVFARWKFADFVEPHIRAGEVKTFWNSVEVPYLPYFAYEEILAPFREDFTDPKTCLAAFLRIANHIAGSDGLSYVSLISPEQQAEVLREFASTPMTSDEEASSGSGSPSPAVAVESLIEKQLRVADSTFMSLIEEEREAARRLWTRLVRVPRRDERADITKVRVPIAECGDATALIEKFKTADLLLQARDSKPKLETVEALQSSTQTSVKRPNPKQETVEAVSDEFVRSWGQLRKWIEDDRDFLLWRQQLQANMAQWIAKDSDTSDLLQGRALVEAEGWYPKRQQDLNAGEVSYVEQSIEQHRKRRKLYARVALASATLVLLLAVGFLVAARYYIQSNSNSTTAQRLSGEAAQQFVVTPQTTLKQQADGLQLGLLLATEAERLSPSADSETILRNYLPMLASRVSINPESNNVLRVALTEDGKNFVAVTGNSRSTSAQYGQPQEDRAIQLQDAATKRVRTRIAFKPGSLIYDLSPDGRFLAVVVSGDSAVANRSNTPQQFTISVIDVAKGVSIKELKQVATVRALTFSPNSRYLAAGCDSNLTTLLDLNSLEARTLKLSGAGVSVAFSPDSKFCATASEASEVQVWAIPEGGLGGAPNNAASVKYVKSNFVQSDFVAARPAQGDVNTLKLDSVALNLAVSRGGNYVAAVAYSDSNTFTVWDVKKGQQVGERLSHSEQGNYIEAMAFSPDGHFIVTAGNHGTIRVWQITQDGVSPFKSLHFDGDVYGLAFSPKGDYLAAGGEGVARLWAVGDAATLDFFKEASFLIHEGNVNDLAFSEDGKFIATAGTDMNVRVWYVNKPLGKDLKQEEPCARLTRNMSIDEWNKYMTEAQPYRRTCQEIQPAQ